MATSEKSAYPELQGLTFDKGSGGLARLTIATATAEGEMFLHGAHVTKWNPAGQKPILWMSREAIFAPGQAIRGGVPICFPWFGPDPADSTAPAHGYARISEWQFLDAAHTVDGGIRVQMETFIAPFQLNYVVEFGRELRLALTTKLPDDANAPQRFEDALHTYFTVSDIRSIEIQGLESSSFVDKMENAAVKPPAGALVQFSAETDRVYFDTIATCLLNDPGFSRQISVAKSGSASTVIWNPWIAKSARMKDFGDNEWPGMVCIETANIAHNSIELSPGQSHTTESIISVKTLT
jgi:glucose-6-phosphate 1-epimerase